MPIIQILSEEEAERRIEAAVEVFRQSQYDALPLIAISPDQLTLNSTHDGNDSFRNAIDEIKSKCDIFEVVEKHVTLSSAGKGLCPFHLDKTPSLSVHREKQYYNCFGCDAGGDVIDFLMRVEKKSFRDVVTELASEAGLPVPMSFKRKK